MTVKQWTEWANDALDMRIEEIMQDGIARTIKDIRAMIVNPSGDKYNASFISASCKRLVEDGILNVKKEKYGSRLVNVYQAV